MPAVALLPNVSAIWRRLAALAGAFAALQAGEPTAYGNISAQAGMLARDFDTGAAAEWAHAYIGRRAAVTRVIAGLRVLQERPDTALTVYGLATLQRTGDLVAEWSGMLGDQWEHRSQMGDAALAALATAPAGILRALGVGLVAAAPEELLEDAADAAKKGAGDLLAGIPPLAWVVIAVLVAGAFKGLFRR